MVSAAELTIDIDVDLGSAIPQLHSLANALRDVAAAQRLVDENMDIDIGVDKSDIGVPAADGGGDAVPDGSGVIKRGWNPDFSNAEINLDPSMGDDAAWRLRRAQMSAMPDTFDTVEDSTDGLIEAFKNVDIRMEQMHNALAKIMPLLLVFIGALPAAIAGLAAVGAAALTAAAAFAAIGGLGALGYGLARQGSTMENLQDVAEDIRDDFLDAFGPVARKLAPMFESAVDGVSRFFDELAARSDTLMKFRDDAAAFGRFLIDFIGTSVQRLGEFTQAAMPILESIGQWIEATDFTNAFAQALRRAIVGLTWLADSIVRALPAMMKFSQGFLNVASIIAMTFGILWSVINVIPGLAEALGTATAAILTLLTATALYNVALAITNSQIYTMAASAIPGALLSLYDYTAATLIAAGANATLANTLGLVVSLLTAGLGIAVALAAFERLNQKISETTGNLRDFGKVSGQLGGTSLGIATGEGAGGTTVVNQNTYNFDGEDRSTRRNIGKAAYTDRYFASGQ